MSSGVQKDIKRGHKNSRGHKNYFPLDIRSWWSCKNLRTLISKPATAFGQNGLPLVGIVTSRRTNSTFFDKLMVWVWRGMANLSNKPTFAILEQPTPKTTFPNLWRIEAPHSVWLRLILIISPKLDGSGALDCYVCKCLWASCLGCLHHAMEHTAG